MSAIPPHKPHPKYFDTGTILFWNRDFDIVLKINDKNESGKNSWD